MTGLACGGKIDEGRISKKQKEKRPGWPGVKLQEHARNQPEALEHLYKQRQNQLHTAPTGTAQFEAKKLRLVQKAG